LRVDVVGLGPIPRILALWITAGILCGCDKAQPAPASVDASTTALTLQDFADGSWTLRVDRRYEPGVSTPAFPTDPLPEESYRTSATHAYSVTVSEGGSRVSIGEEPWLGEITAEAASSLTFDLSHGTFAGGRFIVWSTTQGLQGELTLYGSGVPIAQSERGALLRDSR
jgi:hypothetical protein